MCLLAMYVMEFLKHFISVVFNEAQIILGMVNGCFKLSDSSVVWLKVNINVMV